MQTFDTRFAAASSLRSFFAAHSPPLTQSHLTALLALYDSLNDDDDEVRDVAAGAAKNLIGHALVPLEAADRLLDFLVDHFGSSPFFKSAVADRLVGHCGARAAAVRDDDDAWEPAELELARAMRFDDSLFVVEEQNLFVDEVRETRRWVEVFQRLELDATGEDEKLMTKLVDWVQGGLAHLGTLVGTKDGPLGWASDPAVFAMCTRLVRVSVALSAKTTSSGLEQAVGVAKDALKSHDAQVSGLLTEAWTDV